jgi:endonuclease/exonuclease/phosphatase family metal-dependent hydrolase
LTLQHGVIELNGKKLHVLNHHGHHIEAHKLGDEETMRQVKQISDYVKKLKEAVILCGDFNLSPNSASINQFDEILTNLSSSFSLKQLVRI